LPHLIRLCLSTIARLEVEDLLYIRTREDVMVAAYPLLKSKPPEQRAEFCEPDVPIGRAAQDTCQ
jgi:hypothetical protein